MRSLELLTLASQEHFESLSRLQRNPVFINVLQKFLPRTWGTHEYDIWFFSQPPLKPLARQGFKIHVSATRATADVVLERVIPVCIELELSFKFIADPRLQTLMNSKNASRGSSGKFVVVYPPDLKAFHEAIERLHQVTRDLDGPYILSDARYFDSRVIFYRYGGFWPTSRIELDGGRTPCIEAPDGTLIPDRRLPYFQLPDWVTDPFPSRDDEEDEAEDGIILNGHYRIDKALSFSNGGGVYRATDLRSETQVVIKEARPLTNFWMVDDDANSYLDAPRVLCREYETLQRLKDCRGVVKALDYFQQWEHHYLVEEFVEGIILTRYRALDDFSVILMDGDSRRVSRFAHKFSRLARQIVNVVLSVHAEGIVLCDISPNNFLVDPENLEVVLLDLEAAIDLYRPRPGDVVVRHWSTPGFRSPVRLSVGQHLPNHDLYALSLILFSLIIPIQVFFEIEPKAQTRFLDDLERTLRLPTEVKKLILLLQAGKGQEARELLDAWRPEAPNTYRDKAQVSVDALGTSWEEWGESERRRLDLRMHEVQQGIVDHLLASYDVSRRDRLWAADFKIFETNPLSLACGAIAPLLFLADKGHNVPRDIGNWLLEQELSAEAYPPGLFWGLAGIACGLHELGFENKAAEALSAILEIPSRFDEAGMFQGAAGLGWCYLWFLQRTGEDRYVERAVEAGEHLLRRAESHGEGLAWRSHLDGKIHYGYAYGASGIALFLLRLFEETGDERFLTHAQRALVFEHAAALDPAAPILRWLNDEDALPISEPYWEHGSGGIGSVFIRMAQSQGNAHYLDLARRSERYAFSKFAVLPSQFAGLSGIGDFLLDMYLATREEGYLNRAYAVAETVLHYAVERSDGIVYPGRQLLRLSCDFSTGSCGVGMFLDRLSSRKSRRFVDLESNADSGCAFYGHNEAPIGSTP